MPRGLVRSVDALSHSDQMVGTAGFEQPQAAHFVRTALRAACGPEPAVMKVGAPLAKARSRPHTPGSRVRIQDFESRRHQSEDLGILIRIGDRDGGIQTSAARGLRPRRSLREGRAGQPADIKVGAPLAKVRVSDAREHEYRSSVNAQIGEREH
jgi:hypothetical protein